MAHQITAEELETLLWLNPGTEAEFGPDYAEVHVRGRSYRAPLPRTEPKVCPDGHVLTPDNLLTRATGRQSCRLCEAASLRASRRRAAGLSESEKPDPYYFRISSGRVNVTAFLSHVDKSGGGDCWIWRGTMHAHGYGHHGRASAHRTSFEIFNGPIPDGHQVDHLCYTPACVNPDHLEAVTPQENVDRRFARYTHCKRGHELTEDNVYRHRGFRKCKTCAKARTAEQRQRARDAKAAAINEGCVA